MAQSNRRSRSSNEKRLKYFNKHIRPNLKKNAVNVLKKVSRLHFIYKPKIKPRHLNRLHVTRGYIKSGYFKRTKYTNLCFTSGLFILKNSKKKFFRRTRFSYSYLRNWRNLKAINQVTASTIVANYQTLNLSDFLLYVKNKMFFSYANVTIWKFLIIFNFNLVNKKDVNSVNLINSSGMSSWLNKEVNWTKFSKLTNRVYSLTFNNPRGLENKFDKIGKYEDALLVRGSVIWKNMFPLFANRVVIRKKSKGRLINKKYIQTLLGNYFNMIAFWGQPTYTHNISKSTGNKNNIDLFLGFNKRNRKRKHIWRKSNFLSNFIRYTRFGYYKKLRIKRFFWWSLLINRTTASHKKKYLRKINNRKNFRRYGFIRKLNVRLVSYKKQFKGLLCYNILGKKRKPTNPLIRSVRSLENLSKFNSRLWVFSEKHPLRFNSLNLYYLFLLKKPYLFNVKMSQSINSLLKKQSSTKSNVKKNYDFLLNFYLIKFIENKTNRKVYLNISKTHIKDNYKEADHLVISNWASNVYKYGRRFNYKVPLFNFCLVVYHSFKNKDLELFFNLIELTITKLKFWQHRNFFKFIMFLVESYVSSMFKSFNVTGFQFEVKGKISLGGNSRKKKLSLRIRNTFKSNLKVRSKYLFKPIKTISGALGLKIWIYYV